jgi:hypothetical protein
MTAYWGSGGIPHAFLTSALDRGEWSPRYPLDRWLDGSQSRSGCGGEEKNSQPLPGLEPPIIQPVSQRYTSGEDKYSCVKMD